MKVRLAGLFIFFCCLVVGCASGNAPEHPAEDACVSHDFYHDPQAVVEACKSVLEENLITVSKLQNPSTNLWVLTVESQARSDYAPGLERIVVEDLDGGAVVVSLIVEKAIWDHFGFKPLWADAFFLNVFERLN